MSKQVVVQVLSMKEVFMQWILCHTPFRYTQTKFDLDVWHKVLKSVLKFSDNNMNFKPNSNIENADLYLH